MAGGTASNMVYSFKLDGFLLCVAEAEDLTELGIEHPAYHTAILNLKSGVV